MQTAPFLAALEAAVADLRATAQTDFAKLDVALLNQRPAPASWSILECLEHLNRYSRYYNAAFAKALGRPAAATSAEVAYTWLGRKSVDMMRPTNAKKSSTLKHLNPLGSRLGLEVLTEFDQHQARLLELLAQARHTDLNRKAMPVEFFRLLKLRLGEALEFVVVHQQRHLQQAQRVQAGLRVELAC
ncbi:DinB family protein [Hymenobacter properus]|uniref:DinB family protein n=1 Tax=Hymenobacter properus TaxID=2791026 RepID=A0A931BDK7_9BACT|nr:DinB family protein [Hymenobacter properus]MBF9141920.1 DinB family protein [Hymenobacter properus]MBR7720728.1 DinB family protein [Microvirga sp. SRT04]